MRDHKFRGILAAIISLGALVPLAVAEKPVVTKIPEGTYALPHSGDNKVVYGTDDRIDVYQETNPQRLRWAASTCGLVSATAMTGNADGSFTLLPGPYRQFALPACPDEPFGEQPVVANCSGFMVGPDLIATAGHCYSTAGLNGTRFVFGFDMLDADSPVLLVPGDHVYQGVEIVGRLLSGAFDYCVVRVDRAITAPNARSFQIRRESVIGIGAEVGVIGHPAGLPKKLAFSATTRVRANADPGFFVANLDTYGGNSGSPVINPVTGIIEGILVRGEVDYVPNGSCFNSNVVPDDGGRGEDVSKTTSFMQFIPEIATGVGELSLNQTAFSCSDTLEIEVFDEDLNDTGTLLVGVATDAGDNETVTLTEQDAGRFTGMIAVQTAAAGTGNGTVDVVEGDTISVVYQDADHGSGGPENLQVDAVVDCTPPVLSNVAFSFIGATQATIIFESNEPTVPRIDYGGSCGFLLLSKPGTLGTQHSVTLTGLSKETSYALRVSVSDPAGNTVSDDNGGACYTFTTLDAADYFTQGFTEDAPPPQNTTFIFSPDDSSDGYSVCRTAAPAFPTTPAGGSTISLADDDTKIVNLSGGAMVSLYGASYTSFFVGSNGYITFGVGDNEFDETLFNHFSLPRISVLFDDFNPAVGGGKVLLTQLDDRVVITWQEVLEYFDISPPLGANSFQVELFFNGVIRITYLNIFTRDGLIGFSQGLGTPADFVQSDFAGYGDCSELDSDGDGLSDAEELFVYGTDPFDPDSDGDDLPDGWEVDAGLDPDSAVGDDGATGNPDGDGLNNTEELANGTNPFVADSDFDGVDDDEEVANETDPTNAGVPHAADYNGNFEISLSEILRLIQLFNLDEYHCGAGTEDGFAPGPGNRDCFFHNSDYLNANWSFSLSELLRAIQLYAAETYQRDVFGEDGFRPIFE